MQQIDPYIKWEKEMNLRNQITLARLEKAIKEGHILHGTWHSCRMLRPHCFRNLPYFFDLGRAGQRYQEKVVYGTWDIVQAVLYAVLGSPEKRNTWIYNSIRNKQGRHGFVTFWDSLQMRHGFILVLPSQHFSFARDHSAKMVSSVKVQVIEKIPINPSLVRSWVLEGMLSIKKSGC